MPIFIILNFVLSLIAIWYRHTDKADKQLKDDLGELQYISPGKEVGWQCYSLLHPVLIGEGVTSIEARNDFIKKYKKYLRNIKKYGKRRT